MVGQRRTSLAGQPVGDLLDPLARQAVDDAGVGRVALFEKAPQPVTGVAAVADRIVDVGPVEAVNEAGRVGQVELGDDLATGAGVSGRGQGDARYLVEALVQQRELLVLLAEVVTPLRNAVRFVDREQRDPAALQQSECAFGQQPFRGQIE